MLCLINGVKQGDPTEMNTYSQASAGEAADLQVELLFSVSVNIQTVLYSCGMLQLRKSRDAVQWVSGYSFR